MEVSGQWNTYKLYPSKVWWFLKNLKIKLPYDPAIPLLVIYPKGLKAES